VVEGTARDLAARVEAAGLDGPALLMVGDALRRGGAEAAIAAIEPDKLAI
jgi:uroporphyrin-III C-methyltransferase/precorrin-2 dehydrogenase/sirohydrochlorin ferrochelatase